MGGETSPRPSPEEWSRIDRLSDGRPLPDRIARSLYELLGLECSRDGLARLFQPSYPGVRAFVIEPRVAPDRAVEITLVGVARSGRPVWTGTRAFVLGRDGSLEIHRGFDEIEPDFQHRNTTVDLMRRELELLRLTRRGPSSRLTIDAEGVGRYLCALHGFVFADETTEGPPVRSNRPFDPEVDRTRLIEAAERYLEEAGARLGLGRIAIEGGVEEARQARTAWDLARLRFAGAAPRPVEGSDGAAGATALGRDFLLARDTPTWRAALYLDARDPESRARADRYRRDKTADYQARLARELREAAEALEREHRPTRIKALETLGRSSGPEVAPILARFANSSDRRLAGVARRMQRMLTGEDLFERILAFADDERNDARWRGLALRILAEHKPDAIRDRSMLLRVNPDARLQRAAIPLVADSPQGTMELASMLAANPRTEARPGLDALRLELIERLAERSDPLTLPVLIEEHASARTADPAELLSLSRALVAFTDPRARSALAAASRSFERPPWP